LTYADTSFLISLFTKDANSAAAAVCVDLAAVPFPLTPFGRLELTNAVQLRHFRREITAAEAGEVLAAIASDLASGALAPIATPASMFERAQALAGKHTARLGVRSLDILHVAVALELQAESFLTFDRRQARLARAEGLSTPVRIR
jgi:predicted nucleic acid-binding protein